MTIQNFIDPTAKVPETAQVWHFAVIMDGVELGENVSIGSCAEIGRRSKIGKDSRIGRGTFLPYDSVVGEGVFIGPNCTFTDDKLPKVAKPGDQPYHAEPPIIEDHASIGAGAVILPGVTIGRYAMIGAGAIVTRDVKPHGMVYGNAARRQGESPVSPLAKVGGAHG